MIKKLLIGGLIVGLAAAAVLYFMPWGNYESNLEKSDLTENITETDVDGNILPTLDDIEGLYTVTSGENSTAELLFDIDGLKDTKGAFEKFRIDFNIKDDYENSELTIIIETASVNTSNSMRDESIVSDEFFDSENFPTFEYHSNSLVFKDSVYTLNGELNIMDNINDFSFDFKHLGSGTNKKDENFEAFEGSFEFDRTKYGMPEASGVGNIVGISFYCELTKPAIVSL